MSQYVETSNMKAPALRDNAGFNWQDPLDLESCLTEEERIVRDPLAATPRTNCFQS
jgi:hypothetical protein